MGYSTLSKIQGSGMFRKSLEELESERRQLQSVIDQKAGGLARAMVSDASEYSRALMPYTTKLAELDNAIFKRMSLSQLEQRERDLEARLEELSGGTLKTITENQGAYDLRRSQALAAAETQRDLDRLRRYKTMPGFTDRVTPKKLAILLVGVMVMMAIQWVAKSL